MGWGNYSTTGLELEDTSRTTFGGLGLDLERVRPWPWRLKTFLFQQSYPDIVI